MRGEARLAEEIGGTPPDSMLLGATLAWSLLAKNPKC